ncbi:DNA cytosine methyltransferase (plasmid) [Vibrio scophthalmi]|uniref:DNA cytosine methyltransferase n=1 Tax=Vibrio scophthalmi TaxID=45658 RepID=UPI003EB83B94
MQIKGVDLFAGGGGTTTGAKQGGVQIIWAANHKQAAVDTHALNHPEVFHACQDLHQADFSLIDEHDILYASPACSGHANAAGDKKKTKKADLARSTAWAVTSCAEAQKTPVVIVENVCEILQWQLYPAWEYAMKSLGYSLSVNFINASDLGIPQNRPRVFIIGTRSKHPIKLNIERVEHVSARTIIDLNEDGHKWDLVKNRVPATQNRVANGRKQFGKIFIDSAYGSAVSGRSIDKPLGALTTVNKHSLVIGDKIRSLTIPELAAAASFSKDYIWPKSKTLTKEFLGNAVPPLMAQRVTEAVIQMA